MKSTVNVKSIVIAGLLTAIGILIPIFSPAKIILEPASFTLASHVAIFLAMFISPSVAVAVAIGTSLGFFMTFPIVVALRAVSHIIFAYLGALWLKKHPETFLSFSKTAIFGFVFSLIHAICEIAVVMPFYFGNQMAAYYAKGFVFSVVLLVGLGTVIHSLVDFTLAQIIWKGIKASMPKPRTH